jgi:hypothetical protein
MLMIPGEKSICTVLLPTAPEAFGREILELIRDDPGHVDQSLDVRESIDGLRSRVESLVNSTHPDDLHARRQIAWRIGEYDEPYMDASAAILRRKNDPMEWLLGASHPQIVELLAWNEERLTQLQQRITCDVPAFKEVILSNVDQTIAHGIIPPTARRLAETALGLTRFVAIDTFEAGFRCWDGYFYPNGQIIRPLTIALANGYEGGIDGLANWRAQLPGTVAHEGWHAVAHKARGGLCSILNRNYSYSWFNEAEVQHITEVGFHGEPEITSPWLRTVPGDIYASARGLAHVVKTGGFRRLPQDLLGEAYVESLAEDGPRKARTEVDRLLRRSFSGIVYVGDSDMNVVEFLGSELAGLPAVEQPKAMDAWRQKLQRALGIEDPIEIAKKATEAKWPHQ